MPPAKILTLEGEIDFHLSSEVAVSLREIVAHKPKRVVVDLAKVTYFDSSGLAVLVRGMQDTQEYGGEFSLAAMQENLRPIFEIACLDQVFQIFPDVRCALAHKHAR
jgi:anti-sigma B factor antagonist